MLTTGKSQQQAKAHKDGTTRLRWFAHDLHISRKFEPDLERVALVIPLSLHGAFP